MAQKLITETLALARTFDDARNVSNHELCRVVQAHDTEMWLECRERIIGDLRLGCRNRTNEGALASIRKPDQRNVGHQFHFKFEPTL